MSRSRFENLEPERQQKLFETAAEEFADHGYDGASLNRILDKSGMSKSSLYYYFDDKADLFSTMFERAMIHVLREIGGLDIKALTAETYWSEIEDFYRRSVNLISRNDWIMRLARTMYRARGSKKKLPALDHMFGVAQTIIQDVLKHGQALGVVRTDLPDSLMIVSIMGLGEALDRWTVDHWEEYSKDDLLDLVGVQMAMLERLFGKDAEGSR